MEAAMKSIGQRKIELESHISAKALSFSVYMPPQNQKKDLKITDPVYKKGIKKGATSTPRIIFPNLSVNVNNFLQKVISSVFP